MSAQALTGIYVENVGTVTYQLRELERRVRTRTIKNATRASAKILLAEARRLAPRRNGLFRRSIVLTVRSRGARVVARIGQKKDYRSKRKNLRGSNINRRGYAAPIWFIEQGTASHTIRPSKKGGVLAITTGKGKKAQVRFTRVVHHPGIKAQHVLDRARRAGQRAAAQAWYAEIRKELTDLPDLPGAA